jgi:hypothetical protein
MGESHRDGKGFVKVYAGRGADGVSWLFIENATPFRTGPRQGGRLFALIVKIDGPLKSQLDRHPGESRGPSRQG